MNKVNIKANEVTYIAIHKWSCAMFKKLGFMYLAKKKHNNSHKIEAYKESIDHLLICIKDKIPKITSENKKKDLEILYDNIVILKQAVAKLL